MGLKIKGMVKNVIGNTDLTLEALPGESLRIQAVRVHNPATSYATLQIDRTTVGYFRVGGTLGNHFGFPLNDLRRAKCLVCLMREKGAFTDYPVAEGQTFTITGVAQAGAVCQVRYDVYDAADVKATDPNGSDSQEYTYINYGDTGAALTADGTFLYDNQVSPAEFFAFPFNDNVPAKKRITIFGILFSESVVGAAGPTDTLGTRYVKLTKDRTVLFDDDREGFICYKDASAATAVAIGAGASRFGNWSDVDPRPPLWFENPLVFDPGEELAVHLTVADAAGSPSFPVLQQQIGLICKAEPAT